MVKILVGGFPATHTPSLDGNNIPQKTSRTTRGEEAPELGNRPFFRQRDPFCEDLRIRHGQPEPGRGGRPRGHRRPRDVGAEVTMAMRRYPAWRQYGKDKLYGATRKVLDRLLAQGRIAKHRRHLEKECWRACPAESPAPPARRR
jgi:hypothetical protein